MTVTKAELAAELENELGLNHREALDFLDAFFEEIKRELEAGRPVRLSGFGNFVPRDKGPRPGRNPQTGESALITARRIVAFVPGGKLRLRLNES